jgi:hypothetical protein
MGGLEIVAPPSTVTYNLKVVSHTGTGGNRFLRTCDKNMPPYKFVVVLSHFEFTRHNLGANLVRFSTPGALHNS